MAIKPGMKLVEIIGELIRGYKKFTGKEPAGLDLIKIKQEAVKRFEDMNKVIKVNFGKPFKEEVERMGKNIDDLPPGSRGGPDDIAAPVMNVEDAPEGFIDFVKQRDPEAAAKLQKAEDEIRAKIEAANKRAIENLRKKKKDDPEDFVQGGRVGLKKGMDRRTFMKIMGGLTTLPILGKFAKGAKLVEPVVKKAAEITAPALDKIIEAVMSAGKLVSQSGRRLKELTTKKRLKGVEVEEDMMDGPSYTIKTKDKTIYYRPGRMDEGGLDDDIIEVIEDTVTKKASGGIARMLGE